MKKIPFSSFTLSSIPFHINRERLVLILLVLAVVLSVGAMAADGLLFLRYYRIATELPPAPPQARIEVKKDDFEKAVKLIRTRI